MTRPPGIANDEISKHVRQQVWLATATHEMGHTLNLRHNFQGSFDAVNYFDEYWDICARRPSPCSRTVSPSFRVRRTT